MRTVLTALVGALVVGVLAAPSAMAQAKPAAAKPAATPAAAASKGPSAEEKAMDRAIANYKKNKGSGATATKK